MSPTHTSIGTLLREGRLRQRLSIVECAKNTHISSRYLEALEEERWGDLPSESHRIGFLRLYSRFLGVSADEIVSLYQQSKNTPAADENAVLPHQPKNKSDTHAAPGSQASAVSTKTEDSISGPQWVSIVVIVLLLTWFGYHWIHEEKPNEPTTLWNTLHPRHNRLIASKTPLPIQQLRIHAQSDCWLRILNDQQLVYEGFLRAGSNKTWSGVGPFNVKIGNKDFVSIFWNDQEIDLKPLSGPVLDLKLPLNSTPR